MQRAAATFGAYSVKQTLMDAVPRAMAYGVDGRSDVRFSRSLV